MEPAPAEPYAPLLGSICAKGYTTQTTRSLDKHLAVIWRGMMERCYGVDNKYAKAGIFVCTRWHSLSIFIFDVRGLPRWVAKERNPAAYFLDKDYYGSNYYSPWTCVWLTSKENNMYRANAAPITAINPYGKVTTYLNATECAAALGCAVYAIQQHVGGGVLRLRAKKLLGWGFKAYEGPDILRYKHE